MTPSLVPCSVVIRAALDCAAGATVLAAPVDTDRKTYDLAAGDAAATLKRFAEESGKQVFFLIDVVRGARTNPVRGEFTAKEAIERLVANTALVLVEDEKTGALMVDVRVPNRAKRGDVNPARPMATNPISEPKKTMKKPHPLAVLGAWLTLVIAPAPLSPAADSPQSTGVVEGRIFNAATGNALVNARVILDGTAREAITDETGGYRFTGVTAGAVRLDVFYLGMERQSATVNVPAGGTAQREFELRLEGVARAGAPGDIVKLGAFTVVADREMSAQAIAMNEQRHAPNLKNVVSIDEFGDRGNENIGEFLLFLPGVAIATGGAEPTTVSLRGFPSNNSPITVDGADVAVSWGSNTRTSTLLGVPMTNISRVEVTKVPTPDMPASGLGGSINLISRSGFESKQPKLSFNAYTIFHSHNGLTYDGGRRNHVKGTSPDYVQPSFDFSYVAPLKKDFAITIGGGRTWKLKPMSSGNQTDEQPVWDLVRLVQTSSEWTSIAAVTKILSGQIGFDWRISPQDTFSANLQYRDYDTYQTRSVLTWTYGAGATGGPDFTQGTAAGVGSVEMRTGDNIHFLSETKHYTARYRHRGEVWKLDAAGSYSTSGTDRADILEGHFARVPATMTNLVLRGEGIPGSGGYIPTRYSATTRTGQAVDVYDGANYAITNGDTRQVDWHGYKAGARLDLARSFPARHPFNVKIGAAIDTAERDERSFRKTWVFRPNGASDVDSRLAGRFDVLDEAFNSDSPDIFGKRARWISSQKLYQLFQAQPTWFVEDPATTHQNFATDSRKFSETVSAGYLRTDLRLLKQRLWLVAGVRYERTDTEGSGPLNDINAQYQRSPNGTFLTNAQGQRVFITSDALALRKLRYVERGAQAKQDYDGWYPSLNATYNLSENFVVRAAYARSLGRPNLSNIVPGTTVSASDVASPTITVNNTGLKPWIADSYDLSFESYLFKDGFGSAGVFRKNISNFFGSSRVRATAALLERYGLENDPTLLSYDIVTQENAGDARIDGIEVGYRQALTVLPSWARGIQVFINYTKLSLDGSRTADFSDYNPDSIAAGINFVRPRFFIKGTISHLGNMRRGAINASATVPADVYEYQAKRTRIGLNAQYSLNKHYALYASVMDLGGFVQDLRRYGPTTPAYARGSRLQELGFNTYIGVRGSY